MFIGRVACPEPSTDSVSSSRRRPARNGNALPKLYYSKQCNVKSAVFMMMFYINYSKPKKNIRELNEIRTDVYKLLFNGHSILVFQYIYIVSG